MKIILMVLSVVTFAVVAKAVPTQISTGKKAFRTFDGILADDVNVLEKQLRVYMEDSMGCSKVRLNLNILKDPGFFSYGEFDLHLSVDCDSDISDLQLNIDALCSRENDGEVALFINYRKSGQLVSQSFILTGSESCSE